MARQDRVEPMTGKHQPKEQKSAIHRATPRARRLSHDAEVEERGLHEGEQRAHRAPDEGGERPERRHEARHHGQRGHHRDAAQVQRHPFDDTTTAAALPQPPAGREQPRLDDLVDRVHHDRERQRQRNAQHDLPKRINTKTRNESDDHV